MSEVREMPLSTARLLAREHAALDAEEQAAMILAVNIGSQGGKSDIQKALRQLERHGG